LSHEPEESFRMSVEAENTEAKSSVKDTVRVIIHALILALIVRIFLFQPFNIPSGSMIPTLLVGDYLFVSKYSYGYSRHSLPLSLPLIPGRILMHEPDRGDVAVFKLPSDNRTDYIKRIVGLPGDRIHAPNERMVMDQFWKGLLAAGELWHELGRLGGW
jgi:signal peptidase I